MRTCLLFFRQWLQRIEFGDNRATRSNQICDKLLIHIQLALVLAGIANLVTLILDAPELRHKAQRMRQYVKGDVSVGRPATMPAQRSQAQRMC